MRVVHVARTRQDVEELLRLRDRAEQRVIASRPFLARVVTNRRAFCMSSRRLHRAIEIHCQARQSFLLQPVLHHLPYQRT